MGLSGYTYGQDEPTDKCPYCGSHCDADFADVGIGYVQCGPYFCTGCMSSEIGPYDNYVNPYRTEFREESEPKENARILTKRESETGWYEPLTLPGSSANVIKGRVVSHQVMKATYREEFLGNPLWHDESYKDEWWKKIREE